MNTYNEYVQKQFFQLTHATRLLAKEHLHYFHANAGLKNEDAYFELSLACQPDGKIEQAAFKAYGNPYLLVGLEWLCQRIEGFSKNTLAVDFAELVPLLGLPHKFSYVIIMIEQGYQRLLQQIKQG